MTWLPLLLADPSPCLRFQVLNWLAQKELSDAGQAGSHLAEKYRAEIDELEELRQVDPLVTSLVGLQNADGSWDKGLLGDVMAGGKLQGTGWVLARLGFLGFQHEHPAVQRGAQYLFSQQQADGSWSLQRDRGIVSRGVVSKSKKTGNHPAAIGQHAANGQPAANGQVSNPGSINGEETNLPPDTGDSDPGDAYPRDSDPRDADPGDAYPGDAYPGEEDLPTEGYSMIPLQTAYPLRGLAAAGYASDPRCERAYDWLMAQRLPDGAWPTGIAGTSRGEEGSREGVYGYVAGYRRIAHSRWGCRSNTTGVLACLALHPERRSSAEARRALDLLLGRETRERQWLGFETARLVGAERARGFLSFYARFDLAFLLWLCWQVGATLEDERIVDIVAFVSRQCGEFGLWEYPARPQVSRWVTFDLLRSLTGLDENSHQETGWISLEPRTPFQPYPQKRKRY